MVIVVVTPERRCPPTNGCSSIRCQYGFATDATGCEICSCYEPCQVRCVNAGSLIPSVSTTFITFDVSWYKGSLLSVTDVFVQVTVLS